MKILFRTDSSSQIGLGHVMRDLVLAKQFQNDYIMFACQDLDGNIMQKIDYPIEVLNTPKTEELIEIIQKNSIDMLVIDHYDIGYEDEKKIKEETAVKIFSFDDTYERHHCDVLLNHNISADENRYKGLISKSCELRCGSKYTLIRDEFSKEKEKKKILLAMGGADHSNINIKILKVLKSFKHIKIHVITTTANKNLSELKVYVKKKNWIKLHINSNKIAKLMKKSDFAIVTPSVMLHEVMFMNIPFIAIKTADNQEEMYRYLINNNYLVMPQFDKQVLDKFIASLSLELINFVDLSLDDKEMVLSWRNHSNIRKWMLTKDKISQQSHFDFINRLKTLEDRVYFLLKKNAKAIGVIDFTSIDMKTKEAYFGIYTNPNLKGMGNTLMDVVIDYAFRILKLNTLFAEVVKDNFIAINLYERHGFKQIKKEKNLISMELKNENR